MFGMSPVAGKSFSCAMPWSFGSTPICSRISANVRGKIQSRSYSPSSLCGAALKRQNGAGSASVECIENLIRVDEVTESPKLAQ